MPAAQPKVLLSSKQTEAWQYLEDDVTSEVLFGGAAGPGKTMLGCIWQIFRRIKYPKTHGIIARKVLKDVKESTLLTFYRCAADMGYRPGIDFKYHDVKGRINWRNGSITFLKQLKVDPGDPDMTSLGSFEYTDGFIDEGSETEERGFEVLTSRIRYRCQELRLKPKLLICSNPQIDGWLKRRWIKDADGNPVWLQPHQKFVQARLSDNINKEWAKWYYDNVLSKLRSDYDRARLIDGDWDAQPRTGMEYYDKFSRDTHVGEPEFNPDLPVHISFDFNVSPFITLLVCQIDRDPEGWIVNVIEEICLSHPFNNTEDAAVKFLSLYGDKFRSLFYYGDYTGRNKKTVSKETDFAVIERVLAGRLHNHSNRVRPNKPVVDRKYFMQSILEGKLPIKIKIHSRCRNLIKEMTYMKQAPDGGKLTENYKDPVTGGKYERYGHPSDALEYLLTSAFIEYFSRHVKRR